MVAGTLEVKEGSHAAHGKFWDTVSSVSAEQQAQMSDFHLFSPKVRLLSYPPAPGRAVQHLLTAHNSLSAGSKEQAKRAGTASSCKQGH